VAFSQTLRAILSTRDREQEERELERYFLEMDD
jgi:hypothetical protein